MGVALFQSLRCVRTSVMNLRNLEPYKHLARMSQFPKPIGPKVSYCLRTIIPNEIDSDDSNELASNSNCELTFSLISENE